MNIILVSGVGAVIGYGIVESLRLSGRSLRIIGTDIHPINVGADRCDKFILAEPISSGKYISWLEKVLEENKVDIFLPGFHQEIDVLADNINSMQLSRRIVLNTQELIRVSRDKWETFLSLERGGFSTIRTSIERDYGMVKKSIGNRMLIKPRVSFSSRGIVQVETEIDFYYWQGKLGENFMIQEIVGDDDNEFTVGVFGLGDGRSAEKIALRRKLNKEGSTVRAELYCCEKLDAIVDQMVAYYKPLGPTNLQFRLHHGEYLLLEINPRISSSTSIRTKFGYNEAEMCIDYYCKDMMPSAAIQDVGTVVRCYQDVIIPIG